MREGIASYVTAAVANLKDWPAMATRLRAEHTSMLEAVGDGQPNVAAELVASHIKGVLLGDRGR